MLRIPVAKYDELDLGVHPNAGPSPNVEGMRRVYGPYSWLIRCGHYLYNVDRDTYIKALDLLQS